MGEVVDLDGGGITNVIPAGFTLLSYPWSSDVALNSSGLQTAANEGDFIYVFDTASQSYLQFEYLGDVGVPALNFQWVDSAFNPTTFELTTGLSFFYRNNGADVTWVESQPYVLDQP